MFADSIKHEAVVEARQLRASLNISDGDSEIHDYSIAPFSAEKYRPEQFVKKTASKELYDELEFLLHELWKLNEEHVGESCVAVNVYFELTGTHDSLTHELKEWCQKYFERRVEKRDPKDHDNSYEKFGRLYKEFDRVIGRREHSVDFLCVDMARGYTTWFLFEHTWAELANIKRTGYEPFPEEVESAGSIGEFVLHFGLGRNDLEHFLSSVANSGFRVSGPEPKTKDNDWLLEQISGLADDINLMRPFLIRNFHPEKTIEIFHENLGMAFAWIANQGTGQLIVGPDERALLENIPYLRSTMNVKMRRDGVLIDGYRPWVSAKDLGGSGFDSLAVNAGVVQWIHKTLFQFFDQIDLEAIRNESPDSEDAFAASCVEDFEGPPEQDGGSVVLSRRNTLRIRPMRLDRFLRILESLGCEIGPGKGSERTVFRPGGKKYRLGNHKDVYPDLIRNVLQRAGISRTEWLEAEGQ